MALLELRDVSKRFGGVVAADNVSFDLEHREILGLIGPNGSGKTTLLNIINRIIGADEGSIQYDGTRLDSLDTYQVARMGIARTFQITKLFKKLTVLENMLVPGLAGGHFEGRGQAISRAKQLLHFVELSDLIDEFAGNLSGGQQKLLEFAKANMTEPRLILMDEPFAGVNPAIKSRLFSSVRAQNEDGVSFIMVSHDIPSVYEMCERIIVLESGTLIAEGSPQQIEGNEKVIEAYLGV